MWKLKTQYQFNSFCLQFDDVDAFKVTDKAEFIQENALEQRKKTRVRV